MVECVWACEADSVPFMEGSATLAMVVSSACMMVAVMAQIVTMFRRRPGTIRAGLDSAIGSVLVLTGGRRQAEQAGERALVAGVDGGIDAHAGLQLPHIFVGLVEIDPDRHTLHHLDEVAGGVLRRQDRELRAGARRERADLALEDVVRERVDLERDGLAFG